MRIFISAGEPSGDIHGASLMHALHARRPDIEFVGFGGERMREAGATLLYPLVNLAVMWFARVLANITTFLGLLSRADRYFRHHRPDAVIVIDYPGFHWWIARRAKAHGIPVYYFVPPQLWAWAGWRVEKVRRFVDHVLCTLPFEKTWYAERGIDATYVGHPFFDELPSQTLDADFLAQQRSRPGDIVALLPGSRTQEVKRNLSTLIRSAQALMRDRPGCRFLVASFKASQQAMVDEYLAKHPGLPIETHVGRTPEILELAKACVAVSGSVSLELLYRRVPSVILYRVSPLDLKVARFFMKVKWMCLVNLLAEQELYPEFLTDRCEAESIAAYLRRWLDDPAVSDELRSGLTSLRRRYAEPGACVRAAEYVLRTMDATAGKPRKKAA
jgi:lipid-A-disaccharide synthase